MHSFSQPAWLGPAILLKLVNPPHILHLALLSISFFSLSRVTTSESSTFLERWWAPKSSGGGAARFLHLRRHDAISVHSADNRLTEASWPNQAEVTQIGQGSSRSPANDFLSFWDPSWPPLVKPRSWLHSSGSVRACRENLLSKFSYIRESQTLGNLVPTPHVPRHLGISRGAVIRPPYLIFIIGRSSRKKFLPRHPYSSERAPLLFKSLPQARYFG